MQKAFITKEHEFSRRRLGHFRMNWIKKLNKGNKTMYFIEKTSTIRVVNYKDI